MGSTMALKILFLHSLCFLSRSDGFGIEIEGLIDLGPKWSYEYKFSPVYQESTDKPHYVTQLYDASRMLKNVNEYEDTKQQKLKIKEWRDTKSSLENQSSDKYEYIRNSKKLLKISKKHDFERSNENSNDNERLRPTVGSKEGNKQHYGVKYHSTQLSFHVQLSDENFSKNVENNESKQKTTMRPAAATVGFVSAKKKNVARKIKNVNKLNKNITSKDHRVKDDPKIYDFTLHIFKQNLKIFDNIIKSVQFERIKRKVKSVKKNYIDEFKNFLAQNKGYKIKTNLGNQKVILNTIDSSNKIMQRLVHQLSESLDDQNFVNDNPVKNFQRDIDRQKVIEDKHACEKFSICRNREEYSDFITEVMGSIIQANDSKVKQAADALTEVVKTTDFTNVVDNNVQIEVRKIMKNLEFSEPFIIRSIFTIIRNAIRNKNNPIVIMDPVDVKLAAKTTAFHNLIDILDKNIVKSTNETEWDEIKKQFHEWKDGFRADILNLFQILIKQIKNALDKMDSKTAQQVNENMKILIKPVTENKSARMGTKNPYSL